MRKNISIDELFKEGLSEGREQLNLGAWANMERLLDGKSPYNSDNKEEKKKRRIFPLFGLLLIALISATGALFVRHKLNMKDSHSTMAKVEKKQATPNVASNNGQADSPSPLTSNPSTVQPENTTTINRSAINQDPTSVPSSTQSVNQSENHTKFTATSYTDKSHRDLSNNYPNKSKRNKKTNSLRDLSQHNDLPSAKTPSGPEHNQTYVTSRIPEKVQSNSTKNVDASMMASIPSSTPSKKTTIQDTVEQITRVEQVTGSVLGKRTTNIDTINTSQQVVTRVEPSQPIDYHKSNPRYVDVGNDTENKGSKSEEVAMVPVVKAAMDTEKVVVKSNTRSTSKQHSKWKESFEESRIKLGNTLNRISIRKILAYPGITVGVNAALFNPSHNYGGFHAGVSNLTPINDHWSFLSEIRFFYRSNSGYSVQDIQSSLKGFTSDTTTLSSLNQTIYTYDIDSSVRRYNFKHMFSVEMPLSLQYNLNRLSFYGGVNLAYNMRLNTTMVANNTVAHRSDTLDKASGFVSPVPSNYRYTGDDFKSRFGIGYMFGTSYSFSPNLYLDLRATQTQWDNSKTVTSRVVSSSVFKIPYIQFSLGYRFKKYTPGGN